MKHSPSQPTPSANRSGNGTASDAGKLTTIIALGVVALLLIGMWGVAFNGGNKAGATNGGTPADLLMNNPDGVAPIIPPAKQTGGVEKNGGAAEKKRSETTKDEKSKGEEPSLPKPDSGGDEAIKAKMSADATNPDGTKDSTEVKALKEKLAGLTARIAAADADKKQLADDLAKAQRDARNANVASEASAAEARLLKAALADAKKEGNKGSLENTNKECPAASGTTAGTTSSSSPQQALLLARAAKLADVRTNRLITPSAWKANYMPAAFNANGGADWSFDVLEKQYEEGLKTAEYPRGISQFGVEAHERKAEGDRNILFVDGREHCEASRGFLIRVRQGGFRGKIVYLAYYSEDEANCQPLADDFQPMEIFYRPTPLFEPTLQKFYGVLNYYKAFRASFDRTGDHDATYAKAILVQPEAVFWCNQRSPFDDIPTTHDMDDSNWGYKSTYGGVGETTAMSNGRRISRESIFGVVGVQSDIDNAHVEEKAVPFTCTMPTSGRYNGTDADVARKNNQLIDAFIGTSNIFTLVNFAKLMVEFIERQEYNNPHGAWEIFKSHDPVKTYLDEHLVQMQPAHRYEAAVCQNYLPERVTDDVKCQHCDRHTIIAGTTFCMRQVTYETPNYTPYCLQPYRDAILEVPSKMTMIGYAKNQTLGGAFAIRDRPDGIFSEPADPKRSATEQCPNGIFGVLSMMAGYDVYKVKSFIGSFLSHGDPNCTKMVMLVKANMKFENLEKHFPGRVEIVILDEESEYYPVHMKGCGAADYRFEVAQRWLEKNYHRFRYIMATDSRDYMWQADPFAQLRRTLAKQGYENDEFVASVAETVVLGGSAHPMQAVTYFLQQWLESCSANNCYRRMGHMSYTNGEPFAVLNSGHIIGSSLGLLHYYRFHVRMMRESKHKCDGTDQGLFTYYMYGMLQEAHFPHKVLVFSSSRSGFANLPSPSRMSKRRRTDMPDGMTPQKERQLGYYDDFRLEKDEERVKNGLASDPYYFEYTITDCDNNVIAGLHQFDRHYPDLHYLDRSPMTWRVWKPWNYQQFRDTFMN